MNNIPQIAIHEGLGRKISDKLKRFEIIFKSNKIPYQWVNVNSDRFWEKIREFDCFIYNFNHINSEIQIAKSVLPLIETEVKLKCFPDFNTCWHFDDKVRQYYLSKIAGFPMADSWFFWDRQEALKWIDNATFPLVFKLKGGAGSANVVLIRKKSEAVKLAKKMFSTRGVSFSNIPHKNNLSYLKNIVKLFGFRRFIAEKRGRLGPEGRFPYWQIHRDYVLFQQFFPDNKFDQRVTVIGKRAFTFLRYTRAGDFRASGSGLIDYDVAKNSEECVKIAFDVSEKMKFQCMAYDFVFNEAGKPQIIEISYNFIDSAVRNCSGYFDETLRWYNGHYWPQFCILDMLYPELEIHQPSDSEMQF